MKPRMLHSNTMHSGSNPSSNNTVLLTAAYTDAAEAKKPEEAGLNKYLD